MKYRVLAFGALLLSGLLALAIGGGILNDPAAFHSAIGIVVDEQASLANEMRAAGGTIFATGLLALAGVFIRRVALPALSFSALVYGSYGVARFYSFALDGVPNHYFLWIAGLELFVAAICIAALAVASKSSLKHGTGRCM